MLGGLPLPDIRGTLGTFYYWATDLSSFEEGNTEFGGFLKRLLFEDGVAETVLKGPENPILRQEEAELREKKKPRARCPTTEQAPARGAGHHQGRQHPHHRPLDGGLGPGRDRDPGHEARPEARRLERLGAAHLQVQLPGEGDTA